MVNYAVLMQATNGMLRDYFREFGAIERVVISPERIHGNEPVNAANPVDFFNQQQNGQRNYFAYVTYVAQHGVETALNAGTMHTIQNHATEIRHAFPWNQAACDVQAYLTRVRTPSSVERVLFAEMQRLNDDCFLHILKYLGVLEIIRVVRSCPNFQAAAINHRHIRIDKSGCDNGRMTLMQLRELLRELHFGENISSLYISSRMFSSEALRYVCDRLYCYIGPQLRSLTMAHFILRSEQFERMQPLLVNLEYFDADYNSGFNFQAFNVDWNRLQTLHIRTIGQIDRFLDGTERLPAFPVLTRLLLQCNLLTSPTLIERVVNACPNLTEFIAIHVSDIFTDMSRISSINMTRLTELQQLQRLVLSLTRRHYPTDFVEIICQMSSIQYLMIDVAKNRNRDDQAVNEVNRNLARLAAHLPQLKELQLIGVAVDNANILSLIDVAVNLEKIAILECARFTFVPNFVRSIVDRRRELFRNAGLPTKTLKIIVDQSMFENTNPLVRFQLIYLEAFRYLVHWIRQCHLTLLLRLLFNSNFS